MLKPSDLPDSVKPMVLTAMRRQLGEAKYNEMLVSVGEEGIINLWLAETMTFPVGSKHGYYYPLTKSESQGWRNDFATPLSRETFNRIFPDAYLRRETIPDKSMWRKAWETMWEWLNKLSEMTSGQFLLWISWIAAGLGPLTGTFALVIVFALVYLAAVIYNLDNSWTQVVVAIPVLVGLGLLLWAGGFWLVEGVVQWWGWLGGHFR